MKAQLSSKLFYIAALFLVLSSYIHSQDMKKPDPLKNSTLDMLMGTWQADPYEMMGGKWTENAVQKMTLNGQFFEIKVDGKDESGTTYSAVIYIKPNSDGTLTGWAFDDWAQVSTYTGTIGGNKMSVTNKMDWGTEKRDIEINGNTMVHNVTMVMKDKDGKDMTTNTTITYHKK